MNSARRSCQELAFFVERHPAGGSTRPTSLTCTFFWRECWENEGSSWGSNLRSNFGSNFGSNLRSNLGSNFGSSWMLFWMTGLNFAV